MVRRGYIGSQVKMKSFRAETGAMKFSYSTADAFRFETKLCRQTNGRIGIGARLSGWRRRINFLFRQNSDPGTPTMSPGERQEGVEFVLRIEVHAQAASGHRRNPAVLG